MTTLFGPILAAALMAQIQGSTLEGTVSDDQGKPVLLAQVFFHVPDSSEREWSGRDISMKTDDKGRFILRTHPPLGRDEYRRGTLWAYRPGSAITAASSYRPAPALVLRKPEPRIVQIEGPDGRPVVGAMISPQLVFIAAARIAAELPNTAVVLPLGDTTGPDGKATITYLGAGDQLVGVQITAEPIGTQRFQLVEQPGRDHQGTTINVRLKPTSRLAGRVRNRAGQPIANQLVEVWSKGGSALEPSPVWFKNMRLRTAADGSFQTPDNLLVGSAYRVVIRAPGMEPILSDWITIEDKPRVLLPMIQRPLRTISGRVVDRQGKPVLGVEVFQSGDGPERTATRTDADGRFSLGGFMSQGPVFLFVRGEGFRFFGRLIKPGDGDVAVELIRTSERPTHPMPMLADPIPLEESRALSQRLLKPYWQAYENTNDADKIRILQSLQTRRPRRCSGKDDGVGVSKHQAEVGDATHGDSMAGSNRSDESGRPGGIDRRAGRRGIGLVRRGRCFAGTRA